MIENLLSAISHKGFIIQKICFSEDVMRGAPPSRLPSPFTQFRIISADSKEHPFITAQSHEDAIQKIDSGEAARALRQETRA